MERIPSKITHQPEYRATARVAPTFHGTIARQNHSPAGIQGDRKGRPYISWNEFPVKSLTSRNTGRPQGSPLHFMERLPGKITHQPEYRATARVAPTFHGTNSQ